jgi:hypothetical protein
MAKGIDTNITIIRIDPATQAVARMRQKFGSNNAQVVRDVQKLVKAKDIDLRQLQVIEEKRLTKTGFSPTTRKEVTEDLGGTPLVVAAGGGKEENVVGWRLLGCEDTMGIGILFGQGVGGGMVDCPVDLEWVKRRLRWIPGETDAEIAARAEAYVASQSILPGTGLHDVFLRTVDMGPFQAGDSTMWLGEADSVMAGVMLEADLTDGPSEGRRLTRFGDAVRDVVVRNAAA